MESHSFSSHFSKRNGYLYCEQVCVGDIHHKIQKVYEDDASPFYVYSKNQIVENIRAYHQALSDLGNHTVLGYAVKANSNLSILRVIRQHCDTAVVVSGNELKLAVEAGFPPRNIIFNGCGKKRHEIDLAIGAGCLLNIDSLFDVGHIGEVATRRGIVTRVLIRINPDIEVSVHPYISTAVAQSKFGIAIDEVDEVLRALRDQRSLCLVGFHCHLGSTVDTTDVYREAVSSLVQLAESAREKGWKDVQYINIGGGLGIDYKKHASRTRALITPGFLEIATRSLKDDSSETGTLVENLQKAFQMQHEMTREDAIDLIHTNLRQYPQLVETFEKQLASEQREPYPSPADLVASIKDAVEARHFTLILEPGRSIVGDAGVLITHVIGCKKNGHKRFLITDGSMTEVIRPSLYSAYHHLELAEPSKIATKKEEYVYDIAGPVCESGDFLGKDRLLTAPHEGCSVVMFDVGAYGTVMSSHYNSRLRPAEILVSENTWTIIRYPETYHDLVKLQLKSEIGADGEERQGDNEQMQN